MFNPESPTTEVFFSPLTSPMPNANATIESRNTTPGEPTEWENWQLYYAVDGNPYYYNRVTKEWQWANWDASAQASVTQEPGIAYVATESEDYSDMEDNTPFKSIELSPKPDSKLSLTPSNAMSPKVRIAVSESIS